ncbi:MULTISPECIES: hypothetical protein [Ralstonia]|jgi:hypothetical protein|uniref:Lipoprotein n=3 Tax=Ralstonia TaxID=48736 RepID=A0AAD2BPM4_9RALS|nr:MULTISPECIES: hypothetical protein [Ralstonia]MEA3271364.1 hypothetical protein [Pseudomonadota bacterium]ENZ78480.1 hypothetical protein OR214_01898 [Ralstonia pickettii OR214]MBL4778006.1 hypothetical protein [Ralstonia sp.]MBT2179206.1 hypothetical protein [Ralstonia pickettii]MCL6455359.1 hypothetical protein [Ralstonia pickettii]
MNTNLKYLQRAALVILACQALTACMTTTPNWDKHFGEAVTSVKQAQVINPDAPAGLPALDGYDGKAAVAAMSNYDRSMTRFPAGGTGTGSGGYGGFGGSGYGGSGMSGSFSR